MRRWGLGSVVGLTLVVLASSLAYLGLHTITSGLADQRRGDRLAAAVTAADGIDAVFRTARAETDAVAVALSPWVDPAQQSGRALEVLANSASRLTVVRGGLALAATDGTVLATDPDREILRGQRLSGSHVEAAAAGTTATSGVMVDPVTASETVEIASPVRDIAGDVSGVVVSSVPVVDGPLRAALDRLAPPPEVDIALVGPTGTVLTRSAALAPLDRDGPDTSPPAEAAIEGPGVMTYDGSGGVERFAAYAPVEGGWALVLFEDAASLAAIARTVRVGGAAAVVLVIVAGLIAVVLAERRTSRATKDAELAKRSVLAVAGHELRTPLTVVRGMAQTAIRRWDALPDETRLDLMRTVERQARTLDHLVERLLYAAHLEAGVVGPVGSEDVDLTELCSDAVGHHATLAPLHTLEVEAEDDLMVTGDRKALDQVVFHLLDNAVKYSPSGGTIRVSARSDRRGIELVVEDEGVGLPADPQRLFEAFIQSEAVDTRTRDEGGVGLGLYIVRSLVEQMGGEVWAEPNRPQGARFVVRLRPAAERSEPVRVQ